MGVKWYIEKSTYTYIIQSYHIYFSYPCPLLRIWAVCAIIGNGTYLALLCLSCHLYLNFYECQDDSHIASGVVQVVVRTLYYYSICSTHVPY